MRRRIAALPTTRAQLWLLVALTFGTGLVDAGTAAGRRWAGRTQAP